MRIPDFARRALGIGGAVALLSGCGGSQGLIGQSVSTQGLRFRRAIRQANR